MRFRVVGGLQRAAWIGAGAAEIGWASEATVAGDVLFFFLVLTNVRVVGIMTIHMATILATIF